MELKPRTDLFPAIMNGKDMMMDDLGEWLGDRFQIEHSSGTHIRTAFYRNGELWEAFWCTDLNRLHLVCYRKRGFQQAKEMYDYLLNELSAMDSFICETAMDLDEDGLFWEILVDFYWNPNEL